MAVELVVNNPMTPIDQESKLAFALAYASIGWHVLPLHFIVNGGCSCKKEACISKGKHPIASLVNNGHEGATCDPDTIKRWFTKYPNANIGVNLAKSGLCAVDIDPRNGGHLTLEHLEDKHGAIFSDVMQFTGGGGEHRVFVKPDNISSLPGTLGKGIDLKLNGYIVVEPSNHILKGVYEWEGSSSPLDGSSPSPLPDWIRDLAQTPKVTSDASFISRFVTESQLTELRSALTVIDADDRDTWIKVGTALKTTGAAGFDLWNEYSERSVKFNYADQLRVWQSFKPRSINFETVFFIAQKSGWINTPALNQPMPFDDSQIALLLTKKAVFEAYQPPTYKLSTSHLPGIAGVIESYYNDTAKIPQPMFAKQCALGILSVILGRRFRTSFDDFTSLYFLNIAPSACGKEHVKKVTEDVLSACGLGHLLAGDGYTSAGAVMSALREKPCHISVIDELGIYLEASNNKNNHIGRSANTSLMECIGRLNSEVRSKNYSSRIAGISSAESVLHPAITIQSMTTPSTFYHALTMDMVKDGFFGRFITHNSKMPRVPPRRVKRTPVPQAIIDWADTITYRVNDGANAFINPAIVGNITELEVTQQATDMQYQFSCDMVAAMNELEGSGIEVVLGRYAEFAGRIALMMALSRDAKATIVDTGSAQVGIDYMSDRAQETVSELKENLTETEYQKDKHEILEAIRSVKEGYTERDMHRKSPFSKHKIKDLQEIIQSLIDAEMIVLTNTREGKPGKARMAFIALNRLIDIELS